MSHYSLFFWIYISCLFTAGCGFSRFYRQRPNHVKLINDLPHNVCMCSYHANFIEAVTALHRKVPNLPSYSDGFIQLFLCEISSIECWYGECRKCTGISVSKLKELIRNTSLDSRVSWILWKKSTEAKRIKERTRKWYIIWTDCSHNCIIITVFEAQL